MHNVSRFAASVSVLSASACLWSGCSLSQDAGVPAGPPPENALLDPIATIDISRGGVGSRMWLGDLTGDGRYEFVMAQPDGGFNDAYFPHSVQALTAFDLEGNVLWQVGEPTETARSGSDIPCQLYDLDNDGQLEVLAAMNDEVRVYNGSNGELEATVPLPAEHAHDCILIANLDGDDHPDQLVVKDRYRKVWALDTDGTVRFTFEGNVGHFGWNYDLDGDGKDELIFGYHVLNPDGTQKWSMDLEGHADAIWVADVDGDPSNGVEILVGGDGSYLYNADGDQLWAYEDTVESQNAFPGNFRPDLPGLEVGGLDRIDRGDPGLDGLFLVDAKGRQLYKEERTVPGWASIATVVRGFDAYPGDLFLAYRRGGGLEPGLYDGKMDRRYRFPGELEWAHFMWGDLLNDGRSEVVAYTDGGQAYIFSTDANADVKKHGHGGRTQPKRLYNWTRYWGSETPVE